MNAAAAIEAGLVLAAVAEAEGRAWAVWAASARDRAWAGEMAECARSAGASPEEVAARPWLALMGPRLIALRAHLAAAGRYEAPALPREIDEKVEGR